jgi:hypothetical protein
MSEERKLTHYALITHTDAQELVNQVLDSICKGFAPLGGLAIAMDGKIVVFGQAMVKYSPVEQEAPGE